MMFQCDRCGLCCQNLDKSELYRDLDRGDGTCRYLVNHECSIYESRPLLCRVDECYERFFSGEYTRNEYYELNYKICKKLKEGEDLSCHCH